MLKHDPPSVRSDDVKGLVVTDTEIKGAVVQQIHRSHDQGIDSPYYENDHIAEEVAVALVYNGISHVVMMATPQNFVEFALGFSLSEGIIRSVSEYKGAEVERQTTGYVVNITISNRRMHELKQRRHNLVGRSGCGLCGTESLEQALPSIVPMESKNPPTHDVVQHALGQLEASQDLRSLTGAVHCAAWCDSDGQVQCIREDIGRHNALDKLIGALFANDVSTDDGFVLISSRASYEMVEKACRMKITSLVALSAPTSLAIQIANQANLNLIGFARKGSHTLYTKALSDANSPHLIYY